jgi:FMN-dependent NADH-azoreductase
MIEALFSCAKSGAGCEFSPEDYLKAAASADYLAKMLREFAGNRDLRDFRIEEIKSHEKQLKQAVGEATAELKRGARYAWPMRYP